MKFIYFVLRAFIGASICLPILVRLDTASYNPHLDTKYKGECPPKCKCTPRDTSTNCQNAELQKCPKIAYSTTKYILKSNYISKITATCFSYLPNLTNLNLAQNKIFSVDPYSFQNNSHLRVLDLSQNKLSFLNSTVFTGLHSLYSLTLSNNKIEHIPIIEGAPNLRKLIIPNNHLQDTRFDRSYENITSLSHVILSNNPKITQITRADLMPIRDARVSKLDYSRCSITFIENNSFEGFFYLNNIDLSYNKKLAQNIPKLMLLLKILSVAKLNSLDLSGLLSQPSVLNNKTFFWLRNKPFYQLKIQRGTLETIENGTFTGLQQLVYLDFSYNNINIVHRGVFLPLVKLKRLALLQNKLLSLPELLPPNLQQLQLSGNVQIGPINRKFKNLNQLLVLWLSNVGLGKPPIQGNLFDGVEQLEYLDISNNKICQIPKVTFLSLKRLQTLLLQNNCLTSVSTENKLFSGQLNLVKLNLSNNKISQLSREIFDPLKNLQDLDMSQNNLGHVIQADTNCDLFDKTKKLTKLKLSNNNITVLSPFLFTKLNFLKQLDLSNNKIAAISELKMESKFIISLSLRKNLFPIIQPSVFDSLHNGSLLDFSGNPFNCWCDLRQFRRWLDQGRFKFVHKNKYRCFSPKQFEHMKVVDFDPEQISKKCVFPPWKIIISTACVISIVIAVVVLTVIYRSRYYVYFRFYRWRRKQKKLEDQQSLLSKTIDVYVSADKCDDRWTTKLVQWIEKNDDDEAGVNQMTDLENSSPHSMVVYYRYRDETPGRLSLRDSSEKMDESRRILLVVGDEYLNNRRSVNMEMQLALTDYLETTRIIFRGPDNDDTRLKARLAACVTKPQYRQMKSFDWTGCESDRNRNDFNFKQLNEFLNE